MIFLVDISIYKDEDQLKEIERRQKLEERKSSKIDKKKGKGRPKKLETANTIFSDNNSTKDNEHKASNVVDEKEESDDEDAKLSRSKNRLSKTKTNISNQKQASSRASKSQLDIEAKNLSF